MLERALFVACLFLVITLLGVTLETVVDVVNHSVTVLIRTPA